MHVVEIEERIRALLLQFLFILNNIFLKTVDSLLALLVSQFEHSKVFIVLVMRTVVSGVVLESSVSNDEGSFHFLVITDGLIQVI